MTTLVLPGAGHGSRMGTRADGPPKCLLPVGGRSILDALAEEAHAAGLSVLVVSRPGDAFLSAWRAGAGGPVTVVEAPPAHYGSVVLDALSHLDEPLGAGVGVADSDLVLPPGSLRAFLRHAQANPHGTSLTVGVTADPLDLGPRTIWWQPSTSDGGPGGRIGRGLTGATARLAGVYWFRPAAVKALREFVAAGGTRFGAFLADHPAADVDAFPFAYAFDVNTPEDLAEARERLS